MATQEKISGGDTVRLKCGKEVRVHDIVCGYIKVSAVEYYPIADVVEVIKKFNAKTWL